MLVRGISRHITKKKVRMAKGPQESMIHSYQTIVGFLFFLFEGENNLKEVSTEMHSVAKK